MQTTPTELVKQDADVYIPPRYRWRTRRVCTRTPIYADPTPPPGSVSCFGFYGLPNINPVSQGAGTVRWYWYELRLPAGTPCPPNGTIIDPWAYSQRGGQPTPTEPREIIGYEEECRTVRWRERIPGTGVWVKRPSLAWDGNAISKERFATSRLHYRFNVKSIDNHYFTGIHAQNNIHILSPSRFLLALEIKGQVATLHYRGSRVAGSPPMFVNRGDTIDLYFLPPNIAKVYRQRVLVFEGEVSDE